VDLRVGTEAWIAADFTEFASSLAASAVRERRRFALAIPGGSVVSRLVAPLCRSSIDWARTDLFWCDERCVPPTDPASNYGASKRLLLDPLEAAGKALPRVHRFRGEDPDQSREAVRYASDLERTLGGPLALDVIALGIGTDGHVASLFPGRPALLEVNTWAVVERLAPKPPPVRLTVTLPVIAAARVVVLAAFGSEKAATIRNALAGDTGLPVSIVLREARQCLLYLDHEAGQALT